MKTVFILYEQHADLPYEVGPFYFCSAECRDKWRNGQSVENKALSTRDETREVVSAGCDQCNGNPIRDLLDRIYPDHGPFMTKKGF